MLTTKLNSSKVLRSTLYTYTHQYWPQWIVCCSVVNESDPELVNRKYLPTEIHPKFLEQKLFMGVKLP